LYPPALDGARERERDRLVQTIKDWSIANGLAVRPPPAVAGNDAEGILAMSAPVTLFPSPFPRACFEEARAIQTKYNELYARISQDERFLSGIVEEWVRCTPLVLLSRLRLTEAELLAAMSSLPTCGMFISE
jgi:glutathione synthase